MLRKVVIASPFYTAGYRDVLHACVKNVDLAKDGELIKPQHVCLHEDTICHQCSSCTTTKLYGTYEFASNDKFIMHAWPCRKGNFHGACGRRMLGSFARQRPSIGGACQIGKMAAQLNILLFAFNRSFLPNHCVQ